MLVFIRHGETDSNVPGQERLRGKLPIPLNHDGVKGAEEVADAISELKDVKEVRTGTYVRVVQTSHEVGKALGMELTPMEEYNDWDTGDFAGELTSKVLKDIHDRIQHPLKPVKNGESFQEWLDKIVPALHEVVESDEIYVVVSSGRVATLLEALSKNKGDHPDTDTLLGKPPIDPGGILIVGADWKIRFKTAKVEESKGMS
jgi:broad specificity phosphatase PhoE